MMMDNICILISDKEYKIPVEFDCYAGEEVTSKQKEALELFLSHPEWCDSVKNSIIEYFNSNDIEFDNTSINGSVKPEALFIKREDSPRVAIMCSCIYEPEHGLAIVFSNDGRIEVGIQDIII